MLPGVTVTLQGETVVRRRRPASPTTQGFYRFVALPPGAYTLTFTMCGFGTLNREGVKRVPGRDRGGERLA